MGNPPLNIAARRFLDAQPFTPDRFQVDAIGSVGAGRSVVVTAPTGSGKTLIAEAAIEVALADGRRTFYTTPVKALSNQKYRDLVGRYGEEGTGLLTGDNSINGEAPVVVMTTEVLRNMIYAESTALDDLGVVILDEVHYLQDRYRGSVWEEVIIHLPQEVITVSLSATIANPEEFTGWVRSRRGPTDLVVEHRRPVPLQSTYLVRDRYHGNAVESYPIFAKDGARPNKRLVDLLRKARGRRRRFTTPRRLEVAESLAATDGLPAIYFIFSRAGCDQAAATVAAAGLGFTSAAERGIIRSVVDEATATLDPTDLAVLGFDAWRTMLEQGVAAHHAGMVPAFKEAVERLFAGGHLKLVFATETLALGINMPARAVVIESLSKFTGERHELLRAGDYTQLTGRAGRRGIDERGTAVVLHSPYVPFRRVVEIAGMGSHVLVSSFEPSYNMAVNLVANYPRRRAEELLRSSFAQYRAMERGRRLDERIEERRVRAAQHREEARCVRGDVEEYAALGGAGDGDDGVRAFLSRFDSGDVIEDGSGVRWLVLARGYGRRPRFLLLSTEGERRKSGIDELDAATRHLGRIDLEEPIRSEDDGYAARAAAALAAWRPTGPPAAADTGEGGVAGCPRLDEHLQALARARRVEKELRRLERRRSRVTDDVVERFHQRMSVLTDLEYVEGWDLTAKGRSLRGVYSELDLLLTESVEAGVFDDLAPAEFAALASVFTFEARGGDPEEPQLPGTVEERYERVEEVRARVAATEAGRGVETTRIPDPGFVPYAHAWTSGVDLEEIFDDGAFGVGDFVRNHRQLLDLLRQMRDNFPRLAGTAAAAATAIDRGVVAAGGRV